MSWHRRVKEKLKKYNVFKEVSVVGAKTRGVIDDNRFLEIYFDPSTKSYSYGLVDLRLPYPGDKRVLGWDDYPHEGVEEISKLRSYPHHFQHRKDDEWVFQESPMRGDVVNEVDKMMKVVLKYVAKK
ncbi:hypothetical protein KAU93_03645 [Candidatus Bathyarchaeota archaeon]|nr:hypothetical protein [Candidatus Bathyarchaeota archaeon]